MCERSDAFAETSGYLDGFRLRVDGRLGRSADVRNDDYVRRLALYVYGREEAGGEEVVVLQLGDVDGFLAPVT